MKQYALLFALCVLALPAYASTMCVKNDSVGIVLDPTINGTSYTDDRYNMSWTATFPYGVIRGQATCLSSNYGQGQGGWVENLTDGDDNKPVIGDEQNGKYCWCRMTHPAASRWVRSDGNYGSVAACSGGCANHCSGVIIRDTALRAGLFGSVAN